MDDFILFTKDINNIKELKKDISKYLDIQDLGEAKYFLGIEIQRDRDKKEIKLNQKAFLEKNLKRFNLESLKEALTPSIIGNNLVANPNKATLEETRLFQQQIGSLMYLMTQTRPDIAYSLGNLARYMSNLSKEHFLALSRLWAYLKRTKDLGLSFSPNKDIKLSSYCDSDWGGDKETRKSTTGYLFLIGNTPISWASKLQKTVALSSCEAEYIALKEAIKELSYLKIIFSKVPLLKDIFNNKIYTDSQSAIKLAKNPIYSPRTKYIDIQYHYIRESIKNGLVTLDYISTNSQLADSFTKPIPGPKWSYFLENINLRPLN